MNRYFFGEARDLGTVRSTNARNFRELVDRYLQLPVPLNRTRAEFQALTKSEKAEVKRVNFLVPACYADSPSRRETQYAQACNLIFLDLDDADDARTVWHQPSSLERKLAPWSFAVYTTASHTPESPRLRLVVDADQIPVADYPKAVATLAARLGVMANRESKVAVQPMFLPSIFADQDPDTDHPLLVENRNGEPFRPRDIDPEADTSHTSKPAPTAQGNDLDDLEFLRPPLPEITLEIATEALQSLDPDCTYPLWIECAAALKHQFGDKSHVQKAYEAFDVWSSKGSKYSGPAETKKKWDSLRANPRGRLPVTIRSLIHSAVQHGGWASTEVKQVCYESTRAFILAADSFSTLTVEGVQRVVGTPLLSSTEEDALLNLIVAEARKKHGEKLSISSLRKDALRLRNKIKQSAKEETGTKVPAWAKGVAYVSSEDIFIRHSTGQRWTPVAFDRVYGRKLLPTEEDLAGSDTPVTPARLCTPVVPPSSYVLNEIRCPIADDFAYEPTLPNEVFFVEGGKTLLNTYVRSYPAPKEDATGTVASTFLAHLERLVAEEEYRKVILDWMAYHVQHPGRKIRWAVMLQGVEGCGKSYLAEVMRCVLGHQHVKTVDCAALRQTWNEWAVGHQLVVLEEIRVAGANRHEVMNVLKPLITNPFISVNRRNTDNREFPNRTNYLLFTNHHDAIVISASDRRYFVLQSALQTKAQVKALPRGYFEELFGLVRDRGPELRHFFETWQIADSFDPDADAPPTTYRDALIETSANDVQAVVRSVLADGDHPLLQRDLVCRNVLMERLRVADGIRPPTPQYLGTVLREEGFTHVGRASIGGERHDLWTSPTFDGDAREEAKRRVETWVPEEDLF